MKQWVPQQRRYRAALVVGQREEGLDKFVSGHGVSHKTKRQIMNGWQWEESWHKHHTMRLQGWVASCFGKAKARDC